MQIGAFVNDLGIFRNVLVIIEKSLFMLRFQELAFRRKINEFMRSSPSWIAAHFGKPSCTYYHLLIITRSWKRFSWQNRPSTTPPTQFWSWIDRENWKEWYFWTHSVLANVYYCRIFNNESQSENVLTFSSLTIYTKKTFENMLINTVKWGFIALILWVKFIDKPVNFQKNIGITY